MNKFNVFCLIWGLGPKDFLAYPQRVLCSNPWVHLLQRKVTASYSGENLQTELKAQVQIIL